MIFLLLLLVLLLAQLAWQSELTVSSGLHRAVVSHKKLLRNKSLRGGSNRRDSKINPLQIGGWRDRLAGNDDNSVVGDIRGGNEDVGKEEYDEDGQSDDFSKYDRKGQIDYEEEEDENNEHDDDDDIGNEGEITNIDADEGNCDVAADDATRGAIDTSPDDEFDDEENESSIGIKKSDFDSVTDNNDAENDDSSAIEEDYADGYSNRSEDEEEEGREEGLGADTIARSIDEPRSAKYTSSRNSRKESLLKPITAFKFKSKKSSYRPTLSGFNPMHPINKLSKAIVATADRIVGILPFGNYLRNNYWKKTPPIARLFTLSSAIVTLFSFFALDNRWPNELLEFSTKKILFRLQIWRFFTSFINFGEFGINYLLTLSFVWDYFSHLEKIHIESNTIEEFILLISFGMCSLILLAGGLLGLPSQHWGHMLTSLLVYVWSRLHEGMDVNMMGILTLKAELLPWFFCAQGLLVDGELPLIDLIGIALGHLYLYLQQQKSFAFILPSIRAMCEKPFVKSIYDSYNTQRNADDIVMQM